LTEGWRFEDLIRNRTWVEKRVDGFWGLAAPNPLPPFGINVFYINNFNFSISWGVWEKHFGNGILYTPEI
jgi:hypothetical protein